VRNLILYPAFFLVAAFIQGTIRHLPLVSLHLDLIWLLVLYTGFTVSFGEGVIWVLLLGLAQESIGAPFHGPVVVSYLAVYFFLRASHRQFLFEGGAAQVIWIVGLSVIQKGIEGALLVWQGYAFPFDIIRLLLWAVMEGVVSLLLFSFLRNLGRMQRIHAS
jgi:hypothetical protein